MSGSRIGLVGHTGFVGSNLFRQAEFGRLFNSGNCDELSNGSFELLVCAGLRAEKWRINQDPEPDRTSIATLKRALSTVEADEFILISTIDVYPDPSVVQDEDSSIDPGELHPYGRHRLEFERWVADRFSVVRIIRLPALFGPGLKKNALFDLMHEHETEKINPAGWFQWYPVGRLWKDIGIARRNDLSLVNLFTEPLGMQELIERFFPTAVVGEPRQPGPDYKLQTRYANLFGGRDGYVMGRETCLQAIGQFVQDSRRQ